MLLLLECGVFMYRRRYSAFEPSTPRVGVLPSPPPQYANPPADTAAPKTPPKLSVHFDPNLPKDNDSNNNLTGSENANAKGGGRKARSLSNSPLYHRKKRYGHLPALMSNNGPTASSNYQLLNSANLRDLIDGQRHSHHVSRRDDSQSHSHSESPSHIGHISQSNQSIPSLPSLPSGKNKTKDGKKLKATLTAAMSSSLLRRKAHSNHSQQQKLQLQQQQQELQQQQLQQQQLRSNNSKTIANAARHSLGHSPSAAAAAAAVQQTLVYERRRVSSAHSSPSPTSRHHSPVHQCMLMRRRSDYSVEQIEQWKRQQQLLPRSGRKISVSAPGETGWSCIIYVKFLHLFKQLSSLDKVFLI